MAYTRADQTVENNDEAGSDACYYLHFPSRRDVRASIRARDTKPAYFADEDEKKSDPDLRLVERKKSQCARFDAPRFLMMIQHANKSLMPTQHRLQRVNERFGGGTLEGHPRSACGFIIIYALSLHLLART